MEFGCMNMIFTCIVRKLCYTFSVSFFSGIVQDGNFIVFLGDYG